MIIMPGMLLFFVIYGGVPSVLVEIMFLVVSVFWGLVLLFCWCVCGFRIKWPWTPHLTLTLPLSLVVFLLLFLFQIPKQGLLLTT